jgi:hypothetical protein
VDGDYTLIEGITMHLNDTSELNIYANHIKAGI